MTAILDPSLFGRHELASMQPLGTQADYRRQLEHLYFQASLVRLWHLQLMHSFVRLPL